jgi:hypothetical protein
MRKPGGYAHWFNGDALPDLERDTFTCKHCNGVVFVEPFQSPTDAGGWCFHCAAPVCKYCAGKDCLAFEKLLDRTGR